MSHPVQALVHLSATTGVRSLRWRLLDTRCTASIYLVSGCVSDAPIGELIPARATLPQALVPVTSPRVTSSRSRAGGTWSATLSSERPGLSF